MDFKKVLLSWVFPCALILFNVSCSSKNPRTVNVDEFEKQLLATEGAQLIDVRTPEEFEAGCIPGAKNIDVNGLDFRSEIEKLDKNTPVLIYCRTANRTKPAMAMLLEAGFTTVYELDGGIVEWEKVGKPVDKNLPGSSEISLQEYERIIKEELLEILI